MSESKKYYDVGKSVADGFKRGWKAKIPGIIDDSSIRIVERRVSDDHRDIGLLLYITRSDWDLLDELNRTLEFTCDEIFHRALRLYSVQAKDDKNITYWEEFSKLEGINGITSNSKWSALENVERELDGADEYCE